MKDKILAYCENAIYIFLTEIQILLAIAILPSLLAVAIIILIDEIKEKVSGLGLNESVRFLGQRKDIDELYQAFDVFLLPSLYEGLPVVGVEAQATGLLCILSDDMTKETKVLDTTKFLSLNQGAKKWADILLLNFKNERENNRKEFTDKQFDIKTEASKLKEIYILYSSER